MMSKNINLRSGFNREAQLYHEIRPRYPEPLFDDLVQVTHLQTNGSLLEIGPGTGQATEALAKRGYEITAIELGPDLAQTAREALEKYPNVEILTGAFEEVQFTPGCFDLVYAATAFHWIKPEVRFKKPYDLLKENGDLAIIHTNHVSDELGDEFFFASQPIYRFYKLDNQDVDFRPPKTAEIKPDQLDAALFTPIFFKAYPHVVKYSADEYAKLLCTYSPTIAMPLQIRVGFLRDISNLIDKEFGGSIHKHFAMTLTVARKKG